jgi:hypothetical protein
MKSILSHSLPRIYPSIYLYSCCSHLEHKASMKCFISFQFLNLRQSIALLGQGISPPQGCYLHRTTQTQNKCKHPCLEWDSNPRSQCSSRRRHFMPQTTQPLWLAYQEYSYKIIRIIMRLKTTILFWKHKIHAGHKYWIIWQLHYVLDPWSLYICRYFQKCHEGTLLCFNFQLYLTKLWQSLPSIT